MKRRLLAPPETLQDRVRAFIADELGVDLEAAVDEATFARDLGADSLDYVELVMGLEREFGVEVLDDLGDEAWYGGSPDGDGRPGRGTVGELVALVAVLREAA